MSTIAVERITLFPLQVPLRGVVSHGASVREVSDALVTSIRLSDGTVGYGETLPRPYVTQEDVASVTESIRQVYARALTGFAVDSFPAALEATETLAWHDAGQRLITAARAAIELALLDAVLRVYNRNLDHGKRWRHGRGTGVVG